MNTKIAQAAGSWLTSLTLTLVAGIRAIADGDRSDHGRPRPGRRAWLGDDHRHDGDRRDCPAGGLPRAGGDRRAERLRVGVRRGLTSDPRSGLDQDDSDRGSAVAEFALVLVLLLMLFLALMSVGLWAYTRTLLTSAAADAARVAANYDAADAVATAQVAELLGDGVTGSTRSTLACSSAVTGLLVTVNCTMESPGIIGLLDGVMPTIEVTGHSAKESLG